MAANTIKAHEFFFQAVEGFIGDNCNVESSFPINEALTDIGECSTLQEAFAAPLRHKLFDMAAALRWVLFLKLAPALAEESGDEPFGAGAAFSADAAVGLIAEVYDLGAAAAVATYFEDDSAEEDSAEEDTAIAE